MSFLTQTDWAIDLTHVTKVYKGTWRKRGHVHALRGITMRVNKGEIFGLLGPNGAGKSTLVKILMTVIRATRAEGTMLDHRVGHKPTLARIGYLPEHHRFPEYLTGAEVIDFFGALAKTPRRERRRRTSELQRVVGMTDWATTRGKGSSGPEGPHEGVDIAVATGSIVRAAGGGTVTEAGSDPQFGLFVIIQHPGEYQTLYGHLSRLVVEKGQQVEPGEVIGLAGNTGRSSAPHLHLEVRQSGKTIDPLTMVKQEG